MWLRVGTEFGGWRLCGRNGENEFMASSGSVMPLVIRRPERERYCGIYQERLMCVATSSHACPSRVPKLRKRYIRIVNERLVGSRGRDSSRGVPSRTPGNHCKCSMYSLTWTLKFVRCRYTSMSDFSTSLIDFLWLRVRPYEVGTD